MATELSPNCFLLEKTSNVEPLWSVASRFFLRFISDPWMPLPVSPARSKCSQGVFCVFLMNPSSKPCVSSCPRKLALAQYHSRRGLFSTRARRTQRSTNQHARRPTEFDGLYVLTNALPILGGQRSRPSTQGVLLRLGTTKIAGGASPCGGARCLLPFEMGLFAHESFVYHMRYTTTVIGATKGQPVSGRDLTPPFPAPYID